MLGGYYTAASGILTRQREMDVIGNNLVNMQTPGFRGERMIISPFEQELLTREEAMGSQVLGAGTMATAAVVGSIVPMKESGVLKETGRNFDMAINGEGYYTIIDENGNEFFTRNGQFDMNEEGYLILPGYGMVSGEGGEISLEDENFTVDADGTIYDSEGEEVDKIRVSVVADEDLVKQNNGLYKLADGASSNEPEEGSYSILHKKLELSNIDMNRELTNLIEAQRAFQACSTALQTVDAINRKAATQIASV